MTAFEFAIVCHSYAMGIATSVQLLSVAVCIRSLLSSDTITPICMLRILELAKMRER
jgi:hypothetical protein